MLAYRAREVAWPAFAAGVGAAVALLSPWLVHEWRNGFYDLDRLASEGRSGSGSSAPGAGTVEAFRQTVHLTGALNWGYVTGVNRALFASDAGAAWTLARAASFVVAALLVLGLATCAVRAVRGARRVTGWPWVELTKEASWRALMLVWLVALWLAYVVSATGRVFPHYLLVSYPVSFVVAALGLVVSLRGISLLRFARERQAQLLRWAWRSRSPPRMRHSRCHFTTSSGATEEPPATMGRSTATRRHSRPSCEWAPSALPTTL